MSGKNKQIFVAKGDKNMDRVRMEIEEFRKAYPFLKKTYKDRTVLMPELWKSPDDKFWSQCIWTNFFPVVMPKADYVSLAIEKGKDTGEFDIYVIRQKKLLGVLGDEVGKHDQPIFHVVITNLDESLKRKVVEAASVTE